MEASLQVLAFWVVILVWSFASASSSGPEDFRRAFPIVEPDSEHTKLRLAREGLEAIQRITTPIAAVAVIGPYRSGKSFLLNQLLSLSCDEGFGVGHMRDTKTKGIWVWGTPVELDIDGTKVSVLYLDTEGFESVGKSNVYDDRIFALATVMSSVLIYNLPETIREADISRLSFAVEIAEEFYGRFNFEFC
ncbi:GTP binding protein [Musa troglodytarum]|uniref:GTP binding protein n=1 Tax=Musa troglodytarum TaxID=320322 RepID=A0A9E7FPH4_9LILI|nr:GTP binding protein [Musa troglodytarum]